jgi:hypothetical protein
LPISSSTDLHVFLGLPHLRAPFGFQSSAAFSVDPSGVICHRWYVNSLLCFVLNLQRLEVQKVLNVVISFVNVLYKPRMNTVELPLISEVTLTRSPT